MGLDMYLYAKQYLPSYDPKAKEKASQIQKLFPELSDFPESIKNITYEVGYWRKANAIHAWFVKNVQDNVDDCGAYYVSRETLQNLHSTCCQILSGHGCADVLIPTTSGFFFGNTEYDQYYFNTLEYTCQVINMALKLPGDWYFEYQSSW